MSYAYTRGGAGLPSHHSSHRNPFVEPPTLLERLRDGAVSAVTSVQSRVRRRGGWQQEAWLAVKRVFCIANGLILLWVLTLWRGERTVFRDSLSSCAWEGWEKWPQNAAPHHVAFIADPQLVDPHTYPGRPWPLSTLTVKYTDQYLRRTYSLMQQTLVPDSLFFLGDLFDGGREWATRTSSSPEERYKHYGDKFWLKEYDRFSKIFFQHFNDGGSRSAVSPRGRRIIASLPGNHDLGFGTGIQEPVRKRFQAYFGEGNRIDVVGNHSFVSVNAVSLSAMDQPDPDTGSSGAGAGDGNSPNSMIWRDTQEFLDDVKNRKARREIAELRALKNQSEGVFFHAGVREILEPAIYQKDPAEAPGFPTVLLTHVPLYRRPATPCGPLRERYPPSSMDPLPQEDERNAIKVQGGYQYQNVLTENISNDLISKVGPDIAHIYSGDDHDYCEIAHREFSGSPKEITVKSLSWAMGVRRPGFVMTSLWNPIDPDTGKPIGSGSSPTLQNHLCLLPDQLGIFIQYACLLAFTLVALLIRSIALVFYAPPAISTGPETTLPLSEPRHYDQAPFKSPYSSTSSSATSSPPYHADSRLASRGTTNFSRHNSLQSHDNFRPVKYAPMVDVSDNDNNKANDNLRRYRDWTENGDDVRWKGKVSPSARQRRRHSGFRGTIHAVLEELMQSVKYVSRIVLVWYIYLIWTW